MCLLLAVTAYAGENVQEVAWSFALSNNVNTVLTNEVKVRGEVMRVIWDQTTSPASTNDVVLNTASSPTIAILSLSDVGADGDYLPTEPTHAVADGSAQTDYERVFLWDEQIVLTVTNKLSTTNTISVKVLVK
jgi:hypothetical protein